MGINHHRASIFTIQPYEYKSTEMVIGIYTEKVLEAGLAGLDSRVGDLLTVKFKYNTPTRREIVDSTCVANIMHIVLRVKPHPGNARHKIQGF